MHSKWYFFAWWSQVVQFHQPDANLTSPGASSSFPDINETTREIVSPDLDHHCQTSRLRTKYKQFLRRFNYEVVSTNNEEGFIDYTAKQRELEDWEKEEAPEYPGAEAARLRDAGKNA